MIGGRAPSLVEGAVALSGNGRRRPDAQPELLLDRPLGSRSLLPLLGQARGLLHHIDRYPGLYFPRAAGVALAALIAYQCTALYGVIVTPLDDQPRPAVRQPQPATLLASFDPFFPSGAAPTAAAIAATDLTLYGLRQDGRPGGGSAIISRSDGAQRSFGVGEEIASGIVLKQIGSDHVVVSRHGADERLSFKDFEPAGPANASTARTAPSPYMVTPVASPAARVPPRPTAPRGTGLPPRSVDFADPSTIPASLTTPSR